MTDMLQEIIDRGYRIEPVGIEHGWLEFDTVTDYEKACQWEETGEPKRFFHLTADFEGGA